MKLDRNINHDGKGKYALVRLRNIQPGSKGHELLKQLDQLGYVDWGVVGNPDEFFVVKLRDKFAPGALRGYVSDILMHVLSSGNELELLEYAYDIHNMLRRAGPNSRYCKVPD